jgi:hypothetical protein
MARLPNADRAILDIRKIENYCLNALHPMVATRLVLSAQHWGLAVRRPSGCAAACSTVCEFMMQPKSGAIVLEAAGASTSQFRMTNHKRPSDRFGSSGLVKRCRDW